MADGEQGTVREAVVLAAGEGSRLRPLTDRVPKPLLPIDGEPVLGRVLRQLGSVGVERLTVVVGHRGDDVRRFVEVTAVADEVRFVEQAERRGTAHALQLVLEAQGTPDGTTMVCAADTAWADADVAGLVASHADRMPLATMALLRWPIAELPHHSRVRTGDGGLVEHVLDRVDPRDPDLGPSALSGSPLYAVEPGLWPRIAAVEAAETGGVVELWRALQGAIEDGAAILGHELAAARDLTRPVDLLRHNFPYLGPWLDEATTGA